MLGLQGAGLHGARKLSNHQRVQSKQMPREQGLQLLLPAPDDGSCALCDQPTGTTTPRPGEGRSPVVSRVPGHPPRPCISKEPMSEASTVAVGLLSPLLETATLTATSWDTPELLWERCLGRRSIFVPEAKETAAGA